MTATAMTARSETAAISWRALGTSVRLVVTEPGQLDAGRRLLAHELAVLDLACSRWREDSELVLAERAAPAAVHVSAPLADAIGAALLAAELTDGDLDPTLALSPDLAGRRPAPAAVAAGDRARSRVIVQRRPTWRDIRLDAASGVLTLPAGSRLDLGATAMARTADLAAVRLSDELGCGVLVSVGGDLAVSGEPPAGGWRIRVQELAATEEPAAAAVTTTMTEGGLATMSITTRRWRHGGVLLPQVLDPGRGLSPRPAWRTASVLAGTALHASIGSAGAIIRGRGAAGWLGQLGLPARLVAADGSVRTINGWAGDPS